MDPNETLMKIRAMVSQALNSQPEDDVPDLLELCDAIESLDQWMSKGGFAPAAWMPGRVACKNNLAAVVTYPIEYNGHFIHANDDTCRFEVWETAGGRYKRELEPLYEAASVEECKKTIDEVIADQGEDADEDAPRFEKRAGTKEDGMAYSYATPEFVWEGGVHAGGDTSAIWWADWCGEGPAVVLTYTDARGLHEVDGTAATPTEAEALLAAFVARIKQGAHDRDEALRGGAAAYTAHLRLRGELDGFAEVHGARYEFKAF